MSLRKKAQYEMAIELRKNGFSYNEIFESLKANVSKSTLSYWCRNVPLTKLQKDRLLAKRDNTPLIQRVKAQAALSKVEAYEWARDRIKRIDFRNSKTLLLCGILLYWAEGARRTKTALEFTNTDPYLVQIMMIFFRGILEIKDQDFRVMVRIGTEGDAQRAVRYWLDITGLGNNNLQKSELLKLSNKSISLVRHPYGMCRISIYHSTAYRKVMGLIKEFSSSILLLSP